MALLGCGVRLVVRSRLQEVDGTKSSPSRRGQRYLYVVLGDGYFTCRPQQPDQLSALVVSRATLQSSGACGVMMSLLLHRGCQSFPVSSTSRIQNLMVSVAYWQGS